MREQNAEREADRQAKLQAVGSRKQAAGTGSRLGAPCAGPVKRCVH